EILITEKPSSLITALANLLDIKPEYINADSFRKWRLRTIKKQPLPSSSTPKVRKNRFNQSEESIEDAKYHNDTIDDFIPLTAKEARKSKQEDEESFIKVVKPPRQKY
ncbi:MAG TPA: hypothetical protein VK084_05070, partial [Chitinophagaceae bacterium]|nr:hypothetical protein [Chitinophagaceae bacterium]